MCYTQSRLHLDNDLVIRVLTLFRSGVDRILQALHSIWSAASKFIESPKNGI
jgi:hypothetical protein